MDNIGTIASVVVIGLLALTVLRVFTKPIRFVLKLLLNTVLGLAALVIINFLGAAVGISLSVTWLNALIVGVLGIPGVVLLLVLGWLGVL